MPWADSVIGILDGAYEAPRLCACLYSLHAVYSFAWFALALTRWDVLYRIFFVAAAELPNRDCAMVYGIETRRECVASLETWHFVIFGGWSGAFSGAMALQALWQRSPVLLASVRRSIITTSLLTVFLLHDLAYPMLRRPLTGMHALAPEVRHLNAAIFLVAQAVLCGAVCATCYDRRPLVTSTAPLKSAAARKFRAVCLLDAASIALVVLCSQMATEFLIDLTHDVPVTRAIYFFQRANQCHQAGIVAAALSTSFSSDPAAWNAYSISWFAGFVPCLGVCWYSRHIMSSFLRPAHWIADGGVPIYIAFHLLFLPPTHTLCAPSYERVAVMRT